MLSMLIVLAVEFFKDQLIVDVNKEQDVDQTPIVSITVTKLSSGSTKKVILSAIDMTVL